MLYYTVTHNVSGSELAFNTTTNKAILKAGSHYRVTYFISVCAVNAVGKGPLELMFINGCYHKYNYYINNFIELRYSFAVITSIVTSHSSTKFMSSTALSEFSLFIFIHVLALKSPLIYSVY